MIIPFYKYQGAGNDFIIVDERERIYFQNPDTATGIISFLCHRRFGIGADGLMLLRKHEQNDFRMVYFNSDGREGSMCGNGGRCLVAFAYHQRIIGENTTFLATDGLHDATIVGKNEKTLTVSLQMKDVEQVKKIKNGYYLNTGSPHFVVFTTGLENLNVYEEGRKLRYDPAFGNGGTNINFAEIKDDMIYIRTYERGVEDETLACGTGITAAAIIAFHSGLTLSPGLIKLKALGGELNVSFEARDNGRYENVFLEGPATMVFKGEIEI